MPRDTEFANSLRETLGSESAGRWIEFMDQVASSLSFLLGSAGRPTSEDVTTSVIGRAGFTSWKQMVESSAAHGGLGWSYDSFKAWKKAYAVVQKHPYIRDLGLSSSEINTISRETEQWPPTLDALRAYQEQRKDQGESRRQNSIAALQKQLTALEQEKQALAIPLASSRASVDRLQSETETLQKRLEVALTELGKHHQWKDQASEKIESLRSELKTAKDAFNKSEKDLKSAQKMVSRLENLSPWEHFRAIFNSNR